jgi:hypothetical protein
MDRFYFSRASCSAVSIIHFIHHGQIFASLRQNDFKNQGHPKCNFIHHGACRSMAPPRMPHLSRALRFGQASTN